MRSSLNEDCWDSVFSLLQNDYRALYNSLLVNKALFFSAVPWLYRRPLITFKQDIPLDRMKDLERFLVSQAWLHCSTPQESLSASVLLSSLSPPPSPLSLPYFVPSRTNSLVTTDYYSFVQEMPDGPICHPDTNDPFKHFLDENLLKIRLSYIKLFGSKIKTLALGSAQQDFMNASLPLLHNLTEIQFFNEPQLDQVVYVESAGKAVRFHQSLFPNQLQKIAPFTRTPSAYGLDCWHQEAACTIRDAMSCVDSHHSSRGSQLDIGGENGGGRGGGGRRRTVDIGIRKWGIDRMKLVFLPGIDDAIEKENCILRVLQDVDLPNQLRILQTRHACGQRPLSQKWIESLAIFLSRCRDLDSVNLTQCRPEMLAWAVHEKEAALGCSSHLNTTTTTTITPRTKNITIADGIFPTIDCASVSPVPSPVPLVWWRSLKVETKGCSTADDVSTLWRNIINGFGHCLESISFNTIHMNATHHDCSQLVDLSILDSDYLPHLQSFSIGSSKFGGFSSLAVPNLKTLQFLVQDGNDDDVLEEEEEDGQTGALKRRFPPSLQSLHINVRSLLRHQSLQQSIGHLDRLEEFSVNYWPTREMLIPQATVEKAKRYFDWSSILSNRNVDKRKNQNENTNWSLPRLSKVDMNGYCSELLNLGILLIAPNLTELNIQHFGSRASCEIDLSLFFEQARAHTLIFPHLQSFRGPTLARMYPKDLSTLLGFTSAGDIGDSNTGSGATSHSCGDENSICNERKIMFPSLSSVTMAYLFSPNEDEGREAFMKVIQEGLATICYGSGELERSMRFLLSIEGESEREHWEKWIKNEAMGLTTTKNPTGFSISVSWGITYYQKKTCMALV